jgi:hypothetical protein
MTSSVRGRGWRYVGLALQVGVPGAATFFLGRVVLLNWQALRTYEWHLAPLPLAFSIALLLVACAFPVWPWQLSLCWMDARLGLIPALRIWLLSNLVRYIPGNVWQFLSMAYLCREEGVGQAITLTSIVLSQALSTLSGILIGGLYWLASVGWGSAGQLWPLAIVVLLGLGAVHPAVMGRLVNLLLERLGRPAISLNLGFGRILLLLGLYGVNWLLYGLAFHQFVATIYPIPVVELPRTTAIFASAYVIGFLSLLTPSGLGVRESALVLLLQAFLPLPVATMVALASRLWTIAGEATGAGLILLWSKIVAARSPLGSEFP